MLPIIMVVGPSGAGKNTVLSELKKKVNFSTTISCTTRAPRAGEVDGSHYHFISGPDFVDRIRRNEFAEWATVHDNLYGTLDADLLRLKVGPLPVIFDIDVQGAREIKRKYPESVVVFITASLEELRRRIVSDPKRNHSAEDMDKRLRNAVKEMGEAAIADYIIRNDELPAAVKQFHELVEVLRYGGTPDQMRFCNPTLLRSCLTASL